MTDVEFSRLLTELATIAKTLNEKSDSVTSIIRRFQESLRAMNIGLEVWPVTLRETPWSREWVNLDGDPQGMAGTTDVELGFTKYHDQWVLAVRTAVYEEEDDQVAKHYWTFIRAENITPLLETDRATRIEALEHFPAIAKALKDEADEAIKTIEAAQAYVK
jgi:hypothetical protein